MRTGREQRGSLIAFACACAVHAALVAYMTHVDRPRAEPDVAASIQKPEAAPLTALPPPPPESPPIGEATGSGESVAKVDLPDVAKSPKPREIEQAWTRQRPTLSPPPSEQQPSAAPQPIGPAAPTQLAARKPKLMPPEQSPEGTIAAAKPEPPTPEAEPDARESEAKPEQKSKPPAEAVAAAPPKAMPLPPDPADAGPSDLDPFAKAEGVDFTPGGIEARTGRPVKLVKPRIDLAFMVDATVMRGRKTTILLKIETDETGTPKRVDVVKSSGSRQIDDAIRLAMFSSHFGGKMPDTFPFGITLWQ
jgi:protein TonB